MAESTSKQEIDRWIGILLDYANGGNFGKSRQWFFAADIVTDYYSALMEFNETGNIRSGVGRLVSNLPKKPDTNELDAERLDAMLDIMVARGLLSRRENVIFNQGFEITDKGREWRALNLLVGSEAETQMDRPKIVIVTMREDENHAVLHRVLPISTFRGSNRSYARGTVQHRNGRRLPIAIVRTAEQGPNAAHDTTRDAIEDLDPAWIVLVGIAGGLASQDFTLGDVVVATRLHDFTVGAALEGKPPEYTNQGGPMAPQVRDLVALLPALKENLAGWNDEQNISVPRPAVGFGKSLFSSNEDVAKKVKASLRFHFQKKPRSGPIFTTRAVASSGMLMKDPALMEQWRKSARDTIAVEMELGGAYYAARRQNKEYPVLTIRGISDIVGYKRDDAWTSYACETAGAFCVSLLRNMPEHFLEGSFG